MHADTLCSKTMRKIKGGITARAGNVDDVEPKFVSVDGPKIVMRLKKWTTPMFLWAD